MCQYNLWWPLPLCIFVVHACHAWTFFYPLDFHFYKENPLLSSGPSGHQQQSDCHSGQPGWFIKCFFTKFSMPSISIVFHWPSSQCDFSFFFSKRLARVMWCLFGRKRLETFSIRFWPQFLSYTYNIRGIYKCILNLDTLICMYNQSGHVYLYLC